MLRNVHIFSVSLAYVCADQLFFFPLPFLQSVIVDEMNDNALMSLVNLKLLMKSQNDAKK